MMKRLLTIINLVILLCIPSHAETFTDDIELDMRLGYNIGGVMPLGMPASIRGLNAYTPQINPQFSLMAHKPLGAGFGIMSGLSAGRKAMKIDATVKGYQMVMTQGDESVEGLFTGNVVSKSSAWGVTLPVQATYSITPALRLRLGPYLTYAFYRTFSGYAYDGYLRKDTPTGERVEIGNTSETRGEYDFNDDLRPLQFGLDLGIDWHTSPGFGFYADLQWGLSGAFNSSFKTIEQTMYPIYGTIGIIKTL